MSQHGSRERLTYPAGPFRDWLATRPETSTQLAQIAQCDEATLRHMMAGRRGSVRVDYIDRVTLTLEGAHVLNQLYPVEA